MTRTWISIDVELLGGRGGELWPYPGRTFAVGPKHTFKDLAEAINTAFARWDHALLSLFTLADGRIVTDRETGREFASSMGGPFLDPLDLTSTKVAQTVQRGDEFRYVFDLGDGWTHRCVVAHTKIDPVDELGIVPDVPLPYFGGGTIPDQYGRRSLDDDGQSPLPQRPSQTHPMLEHSWPASDFVPPVDLVAARAAIAAADATAFLDAIRGRNYDDILQQIAGGFALVLEQRLPDADLAALSAINLTRARGGPGDEVLAEALLALLQGEEPAGRKVPLSIGDVSFALDSNVEGSSGAYIDAQTGQAYPAFMADAMLFDADDPIDVESEPERWVYVDEISSHESWQDMADFAAKQRDTALRERLESVIQGKGAFRRFRTLIEDEGVGAAWREFSSERECGRIRERLAATGVRVL